MAEHEWVDYRDNRVFNGLPPEVDQCRDGDDLLDRSKRYIIRRRNGQRVWLPHKCINCGAPITDCISWTRRFYWSGGSIDTYRDDPLYQVNEGDDDWMAKANNRYDLRFFEQCTKCRRVMSWEYVGIAPRGWKAPPMPNWKRKKDVQKKAVYKWQNTFVTKFDGCMAKAQTWKETVKQVHGLFKDWSIKPCEVAMGRREAKKSWMRGRSLMKLAEGWGECRWVQVHEFAHAVVHSLWELKLTPDERVAAHGGLFMAIYILLLEQHAKKAGLLVDDLKKTAKLMHDLKKVGLGVPANPDEEEVEDEED
jgi:hypothetical protein